LISACFSIFALDDEFSAEKIAGKVPLIFGRETNLGLSETAYSLRNDAFSVSTSNPHPNIKAHEYESTFVEDFLRRL